METLKIKVSELNEWEQNPRQITDEAFERLKKSIERNPDFLDKRPLLGTKREGKIIVYAGNQRLKAIKSLGWQEVAVIIDEQLSDEKMKEQAMIDNIQWGNLILEKLPILNLRDDFIKLVGINMDLLSEVNEDNFNAEEYIDKITEVQTKEGDLYELGEHKLLCGDATKKNDFEKLMQNELARLIFTDPPYNVNYRSQSGLSYDSKKFGGTGKTIFNDNKSEEDCLLFYTETLKNLYQFSKDDATIYWWFANKNNKINRDAFENSEWYMSQIVIWVKNSMVFSRGTDYHRQYEPCMVGWKKGKKHYKNKKISNLKDVFNLDFIDFEEMFDIWYQRRDNTTQYIHPTQKPVRLSERALKKNSEIGDIVLDAFGGSGSTLIGCQQKGRKARLMELDTKYCDAIVERYCQFLGKNQIIKNGEQIEWKKNEKIQD